MNLLPHNQIGDQTLYIDNLFFILSLKIFNLTEHEHSLKHQIHNLPDYFSLQNGHNIGNLYCLYFHLILQIKRLNTSKKHQMHNDFKLHVFSFLQKELIKLSILAISFYTFIENNFKLADQTNKYNFVGLFLFQNKYNVLRFYCIIIKMVTLLSN